MKRTVFMNYKTKDDFIEELERKNERLYLILTGHLYIEIELNRLLEKFIPNPEVLKLYKRSFFSKLELAHSLDLVDRPIFDSLAAFNELRNKFAHRLKYKMKSKEVTDIKILVGKIDGFEMFNETITVGGKSSTLIDLKSIMVALRAILRAQTKAIDKCKHPLSD